MERLMNLLTVALEYLWMTNSALL